MCRDAILAQTSISEAYLMYEVLKIIPAFSAHLKKNTGSPRKNTRNFFHGNTMIRLFHNKNYAAAAYWKQYFDTIF